MQETSPDYYENEDELDADTIRTLEAFDAPIISSASDILSKDKQTETSQQSCSNTGGDDSAY